MSAPTRYNLFPDAREPAASFEAMERETKAACEGGFHRPWGQVGGLTPSTWSAWTVNVDPLAVCTALTRVDWEHAPLLVYRSFNEDSWSFLRVVKRVAPVWGEED